EASSLNEEQRVVFNVVVDNAMHHNEQRPGYTYFVYSTGGCNKTYLCKLITSKLYAEDKIVLYVASSGIAFLFLPGGHTAHSQFKVPISIHKDSSYNIKKGDMVHKLLKATV
ncbi:hypothetical protein BDR05DRAFT_882676, partial [Suillus weaverae]